MKSLKLALALIVGLSLIVPLGVGCGNQGEVIPLADVKSPPPLPAQDKSKSANPSGASPDVLPQ